jgi:hypothetical protein
MKIKKTILASAVLISLAILMITPTLVSAVEPPVTVSTHMSLYPEETIGTRFPVHFLIQADGLEYNGPDGMFWWKCGVQVDPSILLIKRMSTGVAGYLLYDFAYYEYYDAPTKTTGYIPEDGYAEATCMFFEPLPPGGAATTGASSPFPSPYMLFTVNFEVVGTGSSKIDIVMAQYSIISDPTTNVDMVQVDGWYGEVGPEFPLGIGLMMILAPMIPFAYLWRLRKKEEMQ